MLTLTREQRDQRSFLLQRAQPAMTGLIDGSLSTLAPIFAGVSMAFSEGLSDTGDLTGRGSPYLRGAITGLRTFLGGQSSSRSAPRWEQSADQREDAYAGRPEEIKAVLTLRIPDAGRG